MSMEDQPSAIRKKVPFYFSGDAGEYFGIWFVNNTLTWLTLGIYSAWAKVRTLQYFYGNTELAGGRFQFTASPWVILRARIIAVALLALYIVVDIIETTLAKIVLFSLVAAYFIFAPILTVFVLSFKFRYSEWRGISFNFNRDFLGAYRVYLAPTLLLGLIGVCFLLPIHSTKVEDFLGMEPYVSASTDADEYNEEHLENAPTETSGEETPDSDTANSDIIDETNESNVNQEHETEQEPEEDTYMNPYLFIPSGVLGVLFILLLPYFDFISTRFLSRNVRLGRASFAFIARATNYYVLYLKWLIAAFIFAILWSAEIYADLLSNFGLLWVLVVLSIAFIPATRAYFKSRRYNLLLSNTEIEGRHRLHANTPFGGFLFLMITNSLAIVFTLGLLGPWAKIRTTKFLMEYTSIEVEGSLDDFVASQQEESNALGEGIADVFDLELGI